METKDDRNRIKCFQAVMHIMGKRYSSRMCPSAKEAAKVILDGVKADRWRILVGADAHRLDELDADEHEQEVAEQAHQFHDADAAVRRLRDGLIDDAAKVDDRERDDDRHHHEQDDVDRDLEAFQPAHHARQWVVSFLHDPILDQPAGATAGLFVAPPGFPRRRGQATLAAMRHP